MSLVGRASLKRLKQLDQRFPIDSGAATAYLNANPIFLAHHRDAHWSVRCTMMDCIYDEITKQLLHPFSIPGALAVTHDI
jgi:hypothetical protein